MSRLGAQLTVWKAEYDCGSLWTSDSWANPMAFQGISLSPEPQECYMTWWTILCHLAERFWSVGCLKLLFLLVYQPHPHTHTHTHFQSIYRIEVIVPLLHAFMPLKQQCHTALYRYTRLYPFHPILFANQFLQTTWWRTLVNTHDSIQGLQTWWKPFRKLVALVAAGNQGRYDWCSLTGNS